MSVADEVLIELKFNDSNEEQPKNITPISVTDEVLKEFKFKELNALQL
jgi:hypothetical protein